MTKPHRTRRRHRPTGNQIGPAIFFCAVGAIFAFGPIPGVLESLSIEDWEPMSCTVKFLDSKGEDGNNYLFIIEYAYTFKGKTYSSRRPAINQITTPVRSRRLRDFSEKWAVGTEHTCYVNPDSPAHAVLSPEKDSDLIVVSVTGSGVVLIGLAFMAYGFRRKRGGRAEAISEGAGSWGMDWRIVALAAFFGVMSMVAVCAMTVPTLRDCWRYQEHFLKPVPCAIESLDSAGYVTFGYEYGGEEYVGGRYAPVSPTVPEDELGQYKPATETTCYVNVRWPAHAVLTTELDLMPACITVSVPLLFVIVPALVVGGAFATRRRAKKWRRSLTRPPRPKRAPTRLATVEARWGGIAVLFLLCLAWNGFSFPFFGFSLLRLTQGQGDYLLSFLFSIPFVGVGVWHLLRPLAIELFRLVGLRPSLIITPGTPRLGEEVELAWQMHGPVERLMSLRVYLEGKETVTFDAGNKIGETAENVFWRIKVASMARPLDMSRGHATFAIPEHGAMSTIHAPHNKITWQLKVCAAVDSWPDFEGDFAVTVLPFEPR